MRQRMQIDVDQRAMAVVRHLRGSPEEVFARPYGGHLLVMAAESDAGTAAWLRHAIGGLDAVTGSEIAFAVFARTFTVAVGVPGSAAERSGHPRLDLAEAQDGGTIRRLVNQGRLGWLATDDELTLVTPGIDETLQAFGVAADLPCLVVVDALPGEQVEVISLRGAGLDALAEVIDTSVRRIARSPGLAAFLATAGELALTEQRMRAGDADAERLVGRLETLAAPDAAAAPISVAYQRARTALSAGATRRFTTVLRQPWRPVPEKLIRAAGRHAAEHRAELLRTDRTARTLEYYLHNFSWPLPEPQRSAYRRVLDRYVAPYLHDVSGAVDDPVRCESLIAALRARNTAIVDTILDAALPPLDVLVRDVQHRQMGAAAAIVDELHDVMAGLEHLRATRLRLIGELAAVDTPSLSAVLGAAARRAGLTVTRRPIGSFASAFAGAALSPATLLEVARLRSPDGGTRG